MITGLSLVVLRCVDVSASRRFYEALGYPSTGHSSRGVRLGFSCANPDEAAKGGLAVGGRLVRSSPLVIEDPDGHLIELSGSEPPH
jgi:catechol 2,3-dioxygenase-like lactoylglutathione lyase family enzyme